MSRFNEYDGDYDDEFNGNGWAMWEKRAELALRGKRGRRALAELREALTALPAPRLVENVMCEPREEGGHDVCVIGAYVWFQKVKGGMDPAEAFAAVPRISGDDEDYDGGYAADDTARVGQQHGLTYTLAWELANRNDETFRGLGPEARHAAFIKFIDAQLAKPPLEAAPRRDKRVKQVRVPVAAPDITGTLGL